MLMESNIQAKAELSARLIHKDGRFEELGLLRDNRLWTKIVGWLAAHPRLSALAWGAAILLLSKYGTVPMLGGLTAGIVTTAGVNYMATDFASGGVTPTISGFKFHASGTGTNAAAVGDTTLQTDSGVARVIGTPTNPSANQYRSVATMAYTSTLAITEWGLFSASSSGTLWDRRVFSAINVVNGDSIQFTYTLTVNNGGS
jgi:hypothetical protein